VARETAHSQWEFREEDEIVPGLTALTLLGGGLRYEAYLAWHERLRALVVAKVVRPELVEDRTTLAGLQRGSLQAPRVAFAGRGKRERIGSRQLRILLDE